MRFHFQNLNERRVSGRVVKTGSLLKHGRARLYYGREAAISVEWGVDWTLAADLHLDPSEDEITLRIGALICDVYLSFARGRVTRWLLDRLLPRKTTTYDGKSYTHREQRSIGFYVHDWTLRVHLWRNRDEWNSSDPKWKEFSINILDGLFGTYTHNHVVIEPQRDTWIPMLEGPYPAKVQLERRTWKRSRWPWWPFSVERVSYDFEIPDGIPFPGKGENAWDCGEDGLFGSGYSAPNEAGAIAQVVATVLTERLKNGGRDCMLRPWPEAPLARSTRSANIRARRAAEEVAEKRSQGNP